MAIIELQQVGYRVKDKQILQKISFSVEKNDFLTLVGPSGIGKSTILKLAANLISPTEGKILYLKQNITQLDPIKYRRAVSYCFQQPALFGKTVKDNLIFPYQIRKKPVNQSHLTDLLEQVDLPANFLNKEITALSGGEKQRVALIRNLIFLPKVLLLDEVTTGLDEQSKCIVHQLIKAIYEQGVTIIQVTHDQSEINSATNIIQIQKDGIKK
ncbi:ABC transporter ATP-binding protein [Lactobacillus kefiranofaciens]|uniref:ABC transport system ATP-binding protein n=1 Tax=Lactobacillus kefiranofaciens TaxID=267818 RepID=A0AAX3UFU5_9LACO|nr:ATP-binding cassette domain-containing protein [Lactobacillus kefiranofaciens]AEG40259.1 ABC superfamily ATP binding cassette transporter, ABC protein [Lactobacillus kefiranofaciens subsp. kefiranofaciens]KRL25593.1 ABC transporter ATP-binding protein [Lactobacillus kefiranofaciens subsp. kefirgranum DSM 10550 = JCM 8572]KRM21841.1 ABC transporter ATP-binding protein [Lactobacillus kefiranofaciens subsp. kefiranofaciens DSM 5016 = JCM 6985]MCJ2171339.1 ATP-binding cassette domain-containing 